MNNARMLRDVTWYNMLHHSNVYFEMQQDIWVFVYTKAKHIKTHINWSKPYTFQYEEPAISINLTIIGIIEHLTNICKYYNIF